SLIVTDDACHQPVALLFAGSSTTTIGNPVGEVLSNISTALGGGTVSFVGNVCVSPTSHVLPQGVQTGELSTESLERATEAMRARENGLMNRPGVIGVGVGAPDISSSDAVIVVYVDVNSPSANVPRRIRGVRVRKVYTEPFVAF